MTARTADRQHSRRHHLLAGCLLLSLLLHAALLARWNAPVTAAAPAGVSALRVTLDTTGNTAPAVKELEESAEELGSDSKFAQNIVDTKKFESDPNSPNSNVVDTNKAEPAVDAPNVASVVQEAHAPEWPTPGTSDPAPISTGEENSAVIDSAAHLPSEEANTAGAIAASVQLELARHFHYPPLAVRRGWQGQVLLAFRVGVDGAIEAVHVAQSSGHALLDRAALGALGKVHKVALQRGPLRAPLELQLPVIYRLEES